MHPVRCPALIYFSFRCGNGLILEGARRVGREALESLAVIECGVGHGLLIGIGAAGAVRICGSLRRRWNPGETGKRSQEAVWTAVDLCYLQVGMEFITHRCTVSMVSYEGTYPCRHIGVCLPLSASSQVRHEFTHSF